MAGSSSSLHEPDLSADVIDRHRAIVSIMEEFEAIDWYDQRVQATDDAELAALLAHNRDEEKEHAAMMLEWLRRRDPALDRMLQTYLYSQGSILEVEHQAEHGSGGDGAEAPSSSSTWSDLGIGSLR
jgi:uncharacterized protein